MRNYTKETLEVAKRNLKDAMESLQDWKQSIVEAPTEYIGSTLENRIRTCNRFIAEYQVNVWALEDFVKDLEDKDQMAKDQEAGKI